eukprot:12029548-Alexandrium_andersonii.AAC.1
MSLLQQTASEQSWHARTHDPHRATRSQECMQCDRLELGSPTDGSSLREVYSHVHPNVPDMGGVE